MSYPVGKHKAVTPDGKLQNKESISKQVGMVQIVRLVQIVRSVQTVRANDKIGWYIPYSENLSRVKTFSNC